MLVDEEEIEPIKKSHHKFNPRLSQEEKDTIERIASLSGYKYNTVRKIFLMISTCAALEIYSGKDEIRFPYLMKINITRDPETGLPSNYVFEPYLALRNLYEKIRSKEETWLQDYFETQIRNSVSEMLGIVEEQ